MPFTSARTRFRQLMLDFRSAMRLLARLRGRTAPVDPAPERTASFYNQRYATKAQKRLPYHLSHYYPLWSVIADRVRGRSVLEVGCGAGQLAALLRDQGVTVYVGFDFSPDAIAIAKTMSVAEFHVADAFTTDLFQTRPFDTIICTEVLEHLTEDRALIQRWPSGVRCLCSVPDFPGTAHVRHFESAERVRDRYADLFSDLSVTTHVRASERPARFFLLDGYRSVAHTASVS
jgi:SAM-dependent methyltransferase